MLSRLFFITNILLLGIVISLKSYSLSSVAWFYELPWLTFLNVFIDISIKSEVSSNSILTFWLVVTIIWSCFLIKQIKSSNIDKYNEKETVDEKPLNIDELSSKYKQSISEKEEKTANLPESVGASFTAALSEAVSSNLNENETKVDNSFFEQANQALSSMTPEAAEKLKKVQTVLKNLESTKINDQKKQS